jgi:hypothetical protein
MISSEVLKSHTELADFPRLGIRRRQKLKQCGTASFEQIG